MGTFLLVLGGDTSALAGRTKMNGILEFPLQVKIDLDLVKFMSGCSRIVAERHNYLLTRMRNGWLRRRAAIT